MAIGRQEAQMGRALAVAPVVGVVPADEFVARGRLFAALSTAFDVVFAACPPDAGRGLDAALVFGSLPEPPGVPALVLAGGRDRGRGPVLLHDTPHLDQRLRGCLLLDEQALGASLSVEDGDVVLGSSTAGPVWLERRGGERHAAAATPVELGPDESMRDQLVDGRFLGLLPLVAFLRQLTQARAWAPPPPRAAFVLDDPNLHASSYGHVDFRELAANGERLGYHVAVASVPADHWLVRRDAVRIFSRSAALSLAIHGNDHTRGELGRPATAARREALIAQALRRTEAFERRTGLRVSRVMVAPHESCSEEMVATMLRSEIEALCYGLGVRGPEWPLADWEPVDLRGHGLPVLPRRPLGAPRGELVLRAYLDQPLILGCHHRDLAAGLDALAEAAAEIDALARPEWCSLETIARSNVATRREGETLRLRPFARRFSVSVPPGIGALTVELPPTHACPEEEVLVVARGSGVESRSFGGDRSQEVLVTRTETLELALRPTDALDHRRLPLPRRNPWAFPRRLAAEGRDRLGAVGRSAPRRRAVRA